MRWVVVMLPLLLFGCTDNNKVPTGIIQQPRMEKILWEMVQADRFVSSFIAPRKDTLKRNRTETIDTYDKVFSYNGITRQQFMDSYSFYLGRPDMLKLMFDSISVRAERNRAEMLTHTKLDSLKKKPVVKPLPKPIQPPPKTPVQPSKNSPNKPSQQLPAKPRIKRPAGLLARPPSRSLPPKPLPKP